jgi:hypothetical protein
MSRDALTPLTSPHDVVRVACAKCGREARYPRERIIARYGKEPAMQDVLRDIADCSQWSGVSDPCGAHVPDLDDDVARRDAEAYMTGHARTFWRLYGV